MSYELKIKEALSRSVCGGWDRRFLESILEQLSKGRDLSAKQRQTLGKVLARNNDEAQKTHENWSTVYELEYKNDALILAEYHSFQPYYRPMASDILANHVPERSKFMRMYDNKYSKKVLIQARSAPKFKVGSYVMPRANFSAYKNVELPMDMTWANQNKIVEGFAKRGGFILEVCTGIRAAAKGAKRYKLLPIGETIPFIVEERYLKKGKRK
jgi:hypothetical protein